MRRFDRNCDPLDDEPVFEVQGHERLEEVETKANSQDMVNCKTGRCQRFSGDSLPR